MHIHLGHHFYGAGNLGDDFMLAGFLVALRSLAPAARFTCCVPFPLEPLRHRFPAIGWLPYDEPTRARAIAECDAWLGLGGSPFQSGQSGWFVDHLVAEAAACQRVRKPMFFLGVGVQDAAELAHPAVRGVCAQAAGIWTRDTDSARHLQALHPTVPIAAGADLAHLFFREVPPPAAAAGRLTLVVNFDYGPWPGQTECLRALARLPAAERLWLAQESRPLPGAELSLHAALSAEERARWSLVSPDLAGTPLPAVLARWPSGEWLVAARHHAAIAGAWARSRLVLIDTNAKLRAAARELGATLVAPDADAGTLTRALASAAPAAPPHNLAARAAQACAAFVDQARRRTKTS